MHANAGDRDRPMLLLLGLAALRMDGTGSLGAVVSDTSQESHSKVQTSEDEGSGEDDALASFEGAEVAEVSCCKLVYCCELA